MRIFALIEAAGRIALDRHLSAQPHAVGAPAVESGAPGQAIDFLPQQVAVLDVKGVLLQGQSDDARLFFRPHARRDAGGRN